MDVFLDGIAKGILVAHALAAVLMLGATTHHAVLAWRGLTGRSVPWRLVRTYATVMFWAQVVTIALGLLVYPAFRVHVRAAFMDAEVPAATGVFEMKEHISVVLMIGLLWMWPASRRLRSTRRLAESEARRATDLARIYFALAFVVAIGVWFVFVSGLSLVTIGSV